MEDVRAARVAIVFCMALSTAVGTWYLRVRIPEKEWLASCASGTEALELGRFSEAERHFLAAVEAARAFGDGDRRLAHCAVPSGASPRRPGTDRRRPSVCSRVRSQSTTKPSALTTRTSGRVLAYYKRIQSATGSTKRPDALPVKIP